MLDQRYLNILIPIDGSKEAELALDKAIAVTLRNGNNAHLHILHVIDTRAFQNVSSFDTSMVEEVSETAKKTLDGYVEKAKAAGITNVSYTIEYGSPKAVIAKEAPKAVNADLIMIGATGLNTVERILIGSVTEYVTRVADVDVLVVRTK